MIKHINQYYLMAGEVMIPDEPATISTVLGSCVSVCLYDNRKKIGGMNHFKGPKHLANKKPTADYGDIAIKNLIEGMVRAGSKKIDIVALVFGGGSVIKYTHVDMQIGKINGEAAIEILEKFKIPMVHQDLGGTHGRRVWFNTSDGSYKVKSINNLETSALMRNRPLSRRPKTRNSDK
jgi:chemotaxis protein CheD